MPVIASAQDAAVLDRLFEDEALRLAQQLQAHGSTIPRQQAWQIVVDRVIDDVDRLNTGTPINEIRTEIRTRYARANVYDAANQAFARQQRQTGPLPQQQQTGPLPQPQHRQTGPLNPQHSQPQSQVAPAYGTGPQARDGRPSAEIRRQPGQSQAEYETYARAVVATTNAAGGRQIPSNGIDIVPVNGQYFIVGMAQDEANQAYRQGVARQRAQAPAAPSAEQEEFTKKLEAAVESAVDKREKRAIERLKGREDFYDGQVKSRSKVGTLEAKRDAAITKAREKFDRQYTPSVWNWVRGRTRSDASIEAGMSILNAKEDTIEASWKPKIEREEERDATGAAARNRDQATERRIAAERARDEKVATAKHIVQDAVQAELPAGGPASLKRLNVEVLQHIQEELRVAGVTMSLREVEGVAMSAARAAARKAPGGPGGPG